MDPLLEEGEYYFYPKGKVSPPRKLFEDVMAPRHNGQRAPIEEERGQENRLTREGYAELWVPVTTAESQLSSRDVLGNDAACPELYPAGV